MKMARYIISAAIILLTAWLSFYGLMPKSNEDKFVPPHEFSVDRAMTPLLEITKKPHYTGSDANSEVRSILIRELHKAGLEPHIQEGFSLNENSKTLTKPINIVAKFPGTEPGKSVLLMSHYDSALVPSFGAADAASGVVTILESVRAYLASGNRPKNDIVVLFTDAEELGLDGVRLFVKEHPWAKDVGVALNFEARGTSGPSNMIIESTHGNAKLIDEFIKANPSYPVTSSLMYSVYKMLPNDTDSTILREEGNINGYFFAFIDNHFNYHTALDTYYNLNRNSLAHQGSYLLPLLKHFGDADLTDLSSNSDKVYFSIPFFHTFSYPFSLNFVLFAVATVIFITLIVIGIRKKVFTPSGFIQGLWRFLIALLLSGLAGYFGWKLIISIYPHYLEIQQGFPYNGHDYIVVFVALSFAITLWFLKPSSSPEFLAVSLFFWLLMNLLVLILLKGAGYFILPVYFALIALGLFVYKKSVPIIVAFLSIPLIFIFAPLIQFFPVGLGMKNIVISCIFTVLTLGLTVPVWSSKEIRKILSGIGLLTALIFLTKAHLTSSFSETRKKPNSLVYFEDSDAGKSYWTTYDKNLDAWTSQVIQNPSGDFPMESPYSKYGIEYKSYSEGKFTGFSKSEIDVSKDTVINEKRNVRIVIHPQRKLNMMELVKGKDFDIIDLKFNQIPVNLQALTASYRGTENSALIRYILPNSQEPLVMEFSTSSAASVSFKLLEYSFDLMENEILNVPPRPDRMMPKPFVPTDAVVVKQMINLNNGKIQL